MREINSFLGHNRPIITTILASDNMTDIISEINRSLADGTEAFCFPIERLKVEYRNRQDFADIFQSMQGKPAYITNYRRHNISPLEQSDKTSC